MEDGAFFSAAEFMVYKPTASLLPLCDDCKLYQSCNTPKMRWDGRGHRKILIVAEYPGKEEDEKGRPLVGGMGRWLDYEFSKFDIDMRQDCWLTNALICHDTNNADPKRAVQDCRPNLLRTIDQLNPNVILLMGGAAIQSLIGHLWKESEASPVGRWAGWRIPAHKPNAWVCPTNNPAYVMNANDAVLLGQFRNQLRAAVKLADHKPWDKLPDYERQVEILEPGQAAQWLDTILDGMVAFDYETNCLKPDGVQAEIVCCSVCHNGTRTVAFPWLGPAIPAMTRLLINPDVGKIGSNIKFETRWSLAKLGIMVRGWRFDTMLAAHALDPRGHISSIKFQAFVRLGVGDYNQHIEPFLGSAEKGGNALNRVRQVKPYLLLKYCGLDSLWEYMVAMDQMREMGIASADN